MDPELEALRQARMQQLQGQAQLKSRSDIERKRPVNR